MCACLLISALGRSGLHLFFAKPPLLLRHRRPRRSESREGSCPGPGGEAPGGFLKILGVVHMSQGSYNKTLTVVIYSVVCIMLPNIL